MKPQRSLYFSLLQRTKHVNVVPITISPIAISNRFISIPAEQYRLHVSDTIIFRFRWLTEFCSDFKSRALLFKPRCSSLMSRPIEEIEQVKHCSGQLRNGIVRLWPLMPSACSLCSIPLSKIWNVCSLSWFTTHHQHTSCNTFTDHPTQA